LLRFKAQPPLNRTAEAQEDIAAQLQAIPAKLGHAAE
jgi:hypothetical protein